MKSYRQVRHPVFTFGAPLLVLRCGCCCSSEGMPGGDGFADAAETGEIRGEKGGFAAMGGMRDGAPVGLGMRIVWCQAATGGRIEHRNRDRFRDSLEIRVWREEAYINLMWKEERAGGGGVSADGQVRELLRFVPSAVLVNKSTIHLPSAVLANKSICWPTI